MRSAVFFLLAVCVGSGLYVATRSAKSEPPTAPAGQAEKVGPAELCPGKIALIWVSPTAETGYALKEAKIQKVAGRDMIVGVGAEPKSWIAGKRVSIALNQATIIIEFTPAEYEKFCEENAEENAAT